MHFCSPAHLKKQRTVGTTHERCLNAQEHLSKNILIEINRKQNSTKFVEALREPSTWNFITSPHSLKHTSRIALLHYMTLALPAEGAGRRETTPKVGVGSDAPSTGAAFAQHKSGQPLPQVEVRTCASGQAHHVRVGRAPVNITHDYRTKNGIVCSNVQRVGE